MNIFASLKALLLPAAPGTSIAAPSPSAGAGDFAALLSTAGPDAGGAVVVPTPTADIDVIRPEALPAPVADQPLATEEQGPAPVNVAALLMQPAVERPVVRSAQAAPAPAPPKATEAGPAAVIAAITTLMREPDPFTRDSVPAATTSEADASALPSTEPPVARPIAQGQPGVASGMPTPVPADPDEASLQADSPHDPRQMIDPVTTSVTPDSKPNAHPSIVHRDAIVAAQPGDMPQPAGQAPVASEPVVDRLVPPPIAQGAVVAVSESPVTTSPAPVVIAASPVTIAVEQPQPIATPPVRPARPLPVQSDAPVMAAQPRPDAPIASLDDDWVDASPTPADQPQNPDLLTAAAIPMASIASTPIPTTPIPTPQAPSIDPTATPSRASVQARAIGPAAPLPAVDASTPMVSTTTPAPKPVLDPVVPGKPILAEAPRAPSAAIAPADGSAVVTAPVVGSLPQAPAADQAIVTPPVPGTASPSPRPVAARTSRAAPRQAEQPQAVPVAQAPDVRRSVTASSPTPAHASVIVPPTVAPSVTVASAATGGSIGAPIVEGMEALPPTVAQPLPDAPDKALQALPLPHAAQYTDAPSLTAAASLASVRQALVSSPPDQPVATPVIVPTAIAPVPPAAPGSDALTIATPAPSSPQSAAAPPDNIQTAPDPNGKPIQAEAARPIRSEALNLLQLVRDQVTRRPAAKERAVPAPAIGAVAPATAADSVAALVAPSIVSVPTVATVVAPTVQLFPDTAGTLATSVVDMGVAAAPSPENIQTAPDPTAMPIQAETARPIRSEALNLLQLVRDQVTRRPAAKERAASVPAIVAVAPTATADSVAALVAPSIASVPTVATVVAPTVQPLPDIAGTLATSVVDMGVQGQWIDGLARDIAGLSANGAQGSFQINSNQLGQVQVDIRQGANGADVSLTVASDEAVVALRQDSDGLRSDAALASVRIGDIRIDRAPAPAEAPRGDTGGQQNGAQSQNGNLSQGMNQGANQGRPQPRENFAAQHKVTADPAVLNHVDAREIAQGGGRTAGRARYA